MDNLELDLEVNLLVSHFNNAGFACLAIAFSGGQQDIKWNPEGCFEQIASIRLRLSMQKAEMEAIKGVFAKLSIPGLYHCHGPGEMRSASTARYPMFTGYIVATSLPSCGGASTWQADICGEDEHAHDGMFIGTFQAGLLFGKDGPSHTDLSCKQVAVQVQRQLCYDEPSSSHQFERLRPRVSLLDHCL